MLNIGIIGPGRIAEKHADSLKKITKVQLWSICGRDFTKVQEFVLKHQALAK